MALSCKPDLHPVWKDIERPFDASLPLTTVIDSLMFRVEEVRICGVRQRVRFGLRMTTG